MPQSVMRKAQPFTIGTKLSLPKYPVVGTLDSGPLPLNERVSQYLAQACPTGHTYASQCASPTGTVSEHCVLARSIRKITLSSPRSPPSGEAVGVHQQYSRGNYNNNNSRALRDGSPRALCQWAVPIPRISGGEDLRPDCFKSLEPPCLVLQRPSAQPSACSRNDLMGRRPTGLEDGVTQLSQDIIQAQMWVRGRLRDLTDTCDVASLPDGDQRAQTTQKDMALFEDTIVKLNQRSEYFCKGETESAHSIRLQLQALRDQWQLLKQTLTNQKRALGGAKALQEFNKKADELEMWMREKEEKPSMSLLLDENNDKIQLTRRILDLKQEQLHYRNLQENINSLAQKLEKQGRMESKAASNRRKQLNKMWLRLQETLLEHQQTLQLALEAATLWQQADSILRAMEGQKSMSVVSNGEDLKGIRDRELRDIASQIMILDVTVSQVSSLHPVLASKANQKQRQVKECWAQLQESLRADKTPRTNGGCTFSREPCSPPLPVQSSMRIKQQEFLGGLSAVPQNGTTSGKAGNKKNKEEFKYGGPVPKVSGVISGHAPELKRRDNYLEQREGLEQEESLGGESTEQNTEETWVLGELTSTEQWLQSLECLISEPAVLQNPETIRQDLKKVSVMERELKSRALALHSLLAKARGPAEQNMREGMKGKIQEVEERFQMVREALQRRVSDLRDTLVLSEFMEIVQKEENRRKKQKLEARGSPAHGSDGTGMEREDRFTPLEELQEAVEMLNDAAKEREKTLALTREMEKLRELLSAVSESVEAAQKRLDELRKETEERESGFAMVKSRAELKDLQEVFIQQKQLEANISGLLRLEVRQLEEQVTRMQELCPEKTQMIGRNVKETLGAWTQLQNGVQGNNSRMQRASQLRRFFQSYLDMISWTEETRSQIFLENPGEKVTLTWREELERRIEEKLKEFEELASIGWKFIGEEHFLAQTIKERLEELQGMLSWVLMRWRCQKKQKTMENKTEWRRSKDKQDSSQVPQEEPSNRHQMAIIPPEAFEKLQSKGSRLTSIPTKGPTLRRYGRKTHSPMSLEQHLCLLSAGSQRESPLGAELLEETSRSKCSEGPLWLEPRELPSAAGTVEEHAEHHMNPLPKPYSSFWKRCQGLLENTFGSLKRKKRVSLPCVEEVSSFLHEKDSEQSQPTPCQSLTVPRPAKKSRACDQYSMPCKPRTGGPSLPKFRANSLFNSLKRKNKGHRCTVQGIMELHSEPVRAIHEDVKISQSHTWPPKQQRKVPEPAESSDCAVHYVKNPLAKDIDAECSDSGLSVKKVETFRQKINLGNLVLPQTYRCVSLGSTLSIELAKDIPGSPKLSVTSQVKMHGASQQEAEHSQNVDSWMEELNNCPGYCRKNLHGYGKGPSNELKALESATEDFLSFDLDRLSPIGGLHEQLGPEWDRMRAVLDIPQDHSSSKATDDSKGFDCSWIYEGKGFSHVPLAPHGADYSFSVVPIGSTKAQCHSGHLNSNQPLCLEGLSVSPDYSAQKREPLKWRSCSVPEVLHPDHELLEQDDEELEGIWNNAKSRGEGVPKTSQVTYHNMVEVGNLPKTAEPVNLCEKAQSGQVVMTAKQNMLVATFTLPNTVLAADSLKKSSVRAPAGENQDNTSTRLGLSSESCPALGQWDPVQISKEKRDEMKGESEKHTRKLDFQLMEGPLERKHILQQGGKKASCRTWTMHYAVLVRRTLCFYSDKKFSSKSSVSAPPLHLTGATCYPDSAYTKRGNCFRLQLADGSEYLLQAPSSSFRQEWVSKLQQNAGLKETDLLGDKILGQEFSPHLASRVGSLSPRRADLCQRAAGMIKGVKDKKELPDNESEGNRMPSHPTSSHWPEELPGESARLTHSSQWDSDIANRRRSRSFSAVTYQKVPGKETTPSYSVTLYISESAAPRGRCHSFATSPEECRPLIGLGKEEFHIGDPKPRQSVFRKFFRKKE
ncbi:uncharacterized protein LOC108716554 isoform X2 [Xenopus laevis]|uniref:Uncharacterized protein LOC108716554 isoform X2 n=1 Tax=Xenopus laevis TaxID=8355 RepID=A0A8J0V6Q0_XENLA|nr:uncharacterized protein LOC108716554 isoform X2 [Xenopus laevis]